MITLYQGPALWGLPNMSPFCIKTEAYLRMAGLTYRTKATNPRKGPKGKIPWIDDGGTVVADSGLIIEHLEGSRGAPLDGGLTAEQRALGHVVRRTFEESLYWVSVYNRWGDETSWPTMKQALVPHMPKLIGPPLLELIRRQVNRDLHAQGYGRHSSDEIYRLGQADLDAIATLLGDKPYVLGDQPSSFDAVAYGFLVSLLWTPFDTPLTQHGQQLDNLQRYCDRLKARYFASDRHTGEATR